MIILKIITIKVHRFVQLLKKGFKFFSFIAFQQMIVELRSLRGDDYFCVKENSVPQAGLLLLCQDLQWYKFWYFSVLQSC